MKTINAISKARSAYGNQKTRCRNPRCDHYEFYGAKGIKVSYSWPEFRDWYVEAIKCFNGSKPSVGRIDHDKDYTLDNIIMQDISENISERNSRHGPPTGRIPIIGRNTITGRTRLFSSSLEAEVMTGIPNGRVIIKCTKKHSKKTAYNYYDFDFYRIPDG